MRLLITTQTVDETDPILGFFHRWILEFASHFEHIDIICLKEGVHHLPKNIKVHSLGKEDGESRIKYTWRFYRYFWNIYMNTHTDYIFFHMGAIYTILAAPFFLFRKVKGTRFLWWKTHGKLNMLGKIALMFVDEVCTAGSKSFAANTKKVRVIGHAIDTNLFSYTVPNVLPTMEVVSIGRIVPIKKIDVAVSVVSAFVKMGHKINFQIVGPPTDLEYTQALEMQITTNHLQEHTSFVGSYTNIAVVEKYHSTVVLLHPAYEAGFDKVVLEAMACGVVPITSIPSFESVLQPFGLYVPQKDIDGYVERLVRIAKMTQNERMNLTSQLREIVVKEHSISTLPKRIFGVG